MLHQAYKASMYGPRYQWLHWSRRHGLFNQLDPKADPPYPDGCTRKQILEAAEGVIYFGPVSGSAHAHIEGVSGYVRHFLMFV